MRFSLHILILPIVVVSLAFIPVRAKAVNDLLAKQWAYNDTGVYTAWTETQGSRDVIVAVIDNGFDMLHPDIQANAWKNTDEIADNGIDDDHNGYIDDVWGWSFIPEDLNKDGFLDAQELLGTNNPRPRPEGLTAAEKQEGIIHHGTVVAGLIGAVGNNGKGISGVAQQVRLMNIRVVDESGSGTFIMLDEAIRYAVDNGADVINMSLVGPTSEDLRSAIEYAYEKGVVIVAAAGNSRQDLNQSPLYPLCEDAGLSEQHILGVSSINEAHQISPFSNYGSSCIDITAPGDGVTSTVRFSPTNGLHDQYIGGWHGTSFAAPLVSGTAALIKVIEPSWGPKEIYTAILSTVQHTSGQDESVYEELFGKGLLQVDKAVAYARERVTSKKGFQDVLVVSPLKGMSEDSKQFLSSFDYTDILTGVDDIASYMVDGHLQYVTAVKKNNTERTITTYSDTWKPVTSFSISARGPVHLAVYDHDLFVAPAYADTVLFQRYSLDGLLLSEFHIKTKHQGVALTISEGGTLYTYAAEPGLVVNTFEVPYDQSSSQFSVSSMIHVGSIISADIDGDQKEEIVVGGAIGERPIISYYENDGILKRTYTVYGAYTDGFSLKAVDYDSDGKDDILTIPYHNTEVVRVWTNKSKKIDEWHTFSGYQIFDQRATVRFY
ncbi:MAG: hypothetical protein COU32_03765 [Candidatus Magasanikbacteria bacterium CG10_big_fil_rev_8_21_14_0_10_42_10]|uniref:Peptidase S8/S53 domain-containing protein n=2 Tax=Candidatus Magasanikiibacteriota TaxID=1752731 RepID=A0A2H0TX82_9BACT|nr:MAG: hypothetical protein COU32_03765 [Candidatus Magasanikbacteria bacterium CG10_big_fil_rev_8_21_14_0_10_42_10]PIZ92941.1 MAG: hypothetical protein COX82_03685 [Candidatus Magasanikbacteria bacterium CG_4_10_14_0_2_um_filter_41_10]